MAKVIQNQQAFIDNIQNIINESLHVTNVDHTEKFGIRRYIHGLIAEGSNDPKLMSYLTNWDNNLNEADEYKSFMEFGNGLSDFASGNTSVKNTIKKMNGVLEASGSELNMFLTIDKIQNPGTRKAVFEAYNNYLSNADYDSRNILIDSVDLLTESQPELCVQLHRMVAENTNELPAINMFMNESDYDSIAAKIKRSNEERKLTELKEKVTEYANQVFEEARKQEAAEQSELCLEGLANSNGIGLNQAIRNIAKSDASRNAKLMAKLDEYAGALNHGLYEERLYETFLLNMSQYEYLLPVEEAVKTIKENVSKNSLAIAITKILEEMQDSSSYYLVKMIEEDCARFVKEPTPQNRVQLRNILCPLAADPFCFKILETIDTDTSKQPSLEEQALEITDQIKLVRENATLVDLYSPIQYIKENECIFNANGKYYVKKGNQLSILEAQYLPQLSENFISLCKLVNDPNVTITDDCIVLNGVGKQAHIYEGYVDINGKRESRESLRNLNEMYIKYDYDTNFFIMASCLHESFNKIAKINFAKHVYLNEDAGINVDLFRLADNLFINATNENLGNSTFYSNANAIQCKKIINDHMGINVSSLFENLLPSQDKIILKLNETQNEYEEAIKKYEEKIEQLEKAAKSCSDENKEKIEDKLKEAKEKVEQLKKEYKEFQKTVKDKTEASDSGNDDEVSGDGDVRDETTVQPMDDKEVEQNMSDLTTPIEGGESGEAVPTDDFANHENDEKSGLSDEEFAKLLDNGKGEEGEEFVDPDGGEVAPEEGGEATPEETPEEGGEEKTPEDLLNIEGEPAEGGEATPEETPEEGGEATPEFNEPEDVPTEEPGEEIPTGDNDEDLANIDADTEGFPEVKVDEPTEEPTVEPEEAPVVSDETGDGEDFELGDGAEVKANEPLELEEPELNPELTEPALASEDLENVSFKIVNVLFDENVKTEEKYKSGTVSIVIPMVSRDGNKYVKNVTYNFYLSGAEATPVIDNDEMSAELYNAICQAIKQDPSYNDIVENGISKGGEEDAVTTENPEAVGLPDTKPEEVCGPEGCDDNGVNPFDGVDFSTDSIFNVEDKPEALTITPSEEEPKVGEGDTVTTTEEPEEILDPEEALKKAEAEATAAEEPTMETPEEGEEGEEGEEKLDFIIPTYKSEDGKTDIELPAPNVDGTEIPESKKTEGNKLNENRQKILGVKSNKSNFFVNEGSNKLSEKKEQDNVSVESTKIVGDVVNEEIVPQELNAVENYDEQLDIDVLNVLYNKACKGAEYIVKNTAHSVMVNPVTEWNVDSEPFNSFDIECDGRTYTIYEIGDRIYNRPSFEFYEIKKDLEDEVPGETIEALKMQFSQDAELDYVEKDNLEDCEYMLNALFTALTGENCTVSDLSENCKIRVKKISSEGDLSQSKLVDDIHYGDKDTRDFEEKIELETQQAGVPNPLVAQPQQEAVEPEILPNIHMIREKLKEMIITYEPNDIVLYDGKKCKVMTVSEDGHTINIMIENGKTVDVEPKDLEPDPEYVNSLNIINQFDDKQKQLLKGTETDKKDIEGKTVDCNIIVDGLRLNCESYKASLKDIMDSKHNIRIMNEDGNVSEYNVDNVDFTEFPYAVIVNEEGKAVRSIQIDPQSYVTAGDDDLVRCWVAGKETQYPKKAINILS